MIQRREVTTGATIKQVRHYFLLFFRESQNGMEIKTASSMMRKAIDQLTIWSPTSILIEVLLKAVRLIMNGKCQGSSVQGRYLHRKSEDSMRPQPS